MINIREKDHVFPKVSFDLSNWKIAKSKTKWSDRSESINNTKKEGRTEWGTELMNGLRKFVCLKVTSFIIQREICLVIQLMFQDKKKTFLNN